MQLNAHMVTVLAILSTMMPAFEVSREYMKSRRHPENDEMTLRAGLCYSALLGGLIGLLQALFLADSVAQGTFNVLYASLTGILCFLVPIPVVMAIGQIFRSIVRSVKICAQQLKLN